MKIVLLHDSFPPQSFGGGGISTYEVAKEFKNLGHTVSVITTCRKKSDAGESEYDGIQVYRIESDYHPRWRWYLSLYNPQVTGEVERILKKLHPDVTQIGNVHYYLSYHCLKIARKYSKRVVFTARDVMTFNFSKLTTRRYLENFDYTTNWRDHMRQAGKRYNPLRNYLIKRYLRYADAVVAISEALAEALRQNGIDCRQVIYNGINPVNWSVDALDLHNFKEKYGLLGKKVLLFSGRLGPAKGSGQMFEAFDLICKEVPGVVLLIAGVGSVEERPNTIFTGWLGDREIKLAYASSDIVLFPSVCFDAFGRVNIEAMSMHKPVVGTCFGGTPEIVEDGVTGYIINPIYPEQISEKVIYLLKNPSQASRMGEAGYERVVAKFDISKIVAQTISLYEKLLT